MEHPLRSYRLKHSLTLDDLAKAVGVNRSTLSKIENRTASPSLDLVGRLVRATGGSVTANDFLSPEPVVCPPSAEETAA